MVKNKHPKTYWLLGVLDLQPRLQGDKLLHHCPRVVVSHHVLWLDCHKITRLHNNRHTYDRTRLQFYSAGYTLM